MSVCVCVCELLSVCIYVCVRVSVCAREFAVMPRHKGLPCRRRIRVCSDAMYAYTHTHTHVILIYNHYMKTHSCTHTYIQKKHTYKPTHKRAQTHTYKHVAHIQSTYLRACTYLCVQKHAKTHTYVAHTQSTYLTAQTRTSALTHP